MSEKLTEQKIRNLNAPSSGQVEYADSDVPGLRIRVGRSGAKTFILRKRVLGKPKNVTLGRHHPTSFNLSDARRKARSLISDLESGGEKLVKIKSHSSSSKTFSKMLPDYVRYIRDEKKNRGWAESARILEQHVVPVLGDRLADAISRSDITQLIDGIANKSTARSTHAQISAFYTWALKRLDKLPSNPARDAGKPPAPKARDRVLSNRELSAIWLASDREPFPWRAAIKLLILTGLRRNEVFAASRSELDFEKKIWTIPASRSKNSIEHLVPLNQTSIRLLATIPQIGSNQHLFPAQRGGSGSASGFSKLSSRLHTRVEEHLKAPVPHWTLHDIRRTVATGMQRLGIKQEVTEAVLNHVSGSKAGIVGVYQRHHFTEEKRIAIDAWTNEVEQIIINEDSIDIRTSTGLISL